MNTKKLGLLLGMPIALSGSLLAGSDKPVEARGENAEWQGLRSTAQQYITAFNKKDAKGLGSLFTEDGTIVAAGGNAFVGRSEIVQHFETIFKKSARGEKIAIEASSVEFVRPNVVVEEGVVYFMDGANSRANPYSAVLVKNAKGEWKIRLSRPHLESDRRSVPDQLGRLEGLVGDWVALVGDGGKLKMNFSWGLSGSWLIGKGAYVSPSTEPLAMSVRIGWDAKAQKVVSWTFDSLGGASKGVWTKADGKWLIKSSGVNAEGENTSSTQTLRASTGKAVEWKFSDRIVGNEVLDDSSFSLVKSPPKPQTK